MESRRRHSFFRRDQERGARRRGGAVLRQGVAGGAAERRKKAGMLFSKHRFLAVQWDAFFADDLWLRLARLANDRATALGEGLRKIVGAEVPHPVEANEVFVKLPEAVIDRLDADGFHFYRRGGGVIRLVTSYETSEAEVEQFGVGRQNPRRLSLFFRP